MQSEKEKIDIYLEKELLYILNEQSLKEFPLTISVEQDNLPDIERWCENE